MFLWRRRWHPIPLLLPGKSHGWRSLVGCSPWGGQESDTTQQLHYHFSLSCIGEGNGNPFQCSCLENPRDGGAWWAPSMGSRLSSSSSKYSRNHIWKYRLWYSHCFEIKEMAFLPSSDLRLLGHHYQDTLISCWTPNVQYSSVAQSCLPLCNPMNPSTPGIPVHH